MNVAETVEIRKPKNTWKKETFRGKVREMQIGDGIEIPSELSARQSAYYNAKAAMCDATFSVKKQDDGSFKLIRVS